MLETGVATVSTVTGSAVGGVSTPFFPSEGVVNNLVDDFHNDSSRFLDRSSIGHVDDVQTDCNFTSSLQSITCNPDRATSTFCEMSDILGLKSDNQHVSSNKPKGNGLIPYNDSEIMNSGDESAFSMNLHWNKSGCMSAHSGDSSSFAYNVETFPPLMSTGTKESLPNIIDTTTTGVAPAASKRAITGGHNTSKYGTATRADTWTTSLNGSMGLVSSSSWVPMNTEADKVPITAYNSCSHGNSSAVSPCGTNLTWAQMLTQQQQTNNKSCFVESSFGGTNIKSPVRPGSSILSTNLYSNNTSKCPNGNSLTSIYTMFPKKPQHRMMAQWQQLQQQQHQQQHPHTTLQDQLARAPGSMPSNSGQLTASQTTSSSLDVNNMLFGTGGSGDSGCNFNSSSMFQPPCTISSQHAIGQFPVGSSGDSFPSIMSSMNTTVDVTPLDSLKFGFEQKMIDVIKSFESTGISQSTRANIANKEGALVVGGTGADEISPFNEVENHFPMLNNNVGHLSVLNSNPTSVAPGFSEMNGTNNHAANIRNMPAPNMLGSTNMGSPYTMYTNIPAREEGYSRKVFVGGLPPDIDEEEITTAFRRFGPLIVDWPHKTESKAYFPPKGYCFLLFQDERSVQSLISACIVDESKFYWCVSSPTMKDKPVQIRPWNLADSDFVMDGSQPLDPRKTIFVGGVPRPLRAIELALIMDRLYNGVCYAGIDTDPELKYPKGAGRVAFSNQQSYIAAISARFVQLQLNEIDKRVEVKPYVLDNQMCDECQGARCGGKFAPFFCANVTCLQYYCEQCWVHIHSRNGREYHKPLVKEGAERLRPAPYRW